MEAGRDVRGDNVLTTVNELLFFDSKQDALALYETFREAVLEKVPDIRIEVKKTQISFFNRRMFAAVSFLQVAVFCRCVPLSM